jgi:hypothetical protein
VSSSEGVVVGLLGGSVVVVNVRLGCVNVTVVRDSVVSVVRTVDEGGGAGVEDEAGGGGGVEDEARVLELIRVVVEVELALVDVLVAELVLEVLFVLGNGGSVCIVKRPSVVSV